MQKFMKIVVAFLLVISIGLPSATTSSSAAEQWTAYPANTTGDVNKPWKVTFSDQVNSDSVSQQNVYVKRANGTNVDVEVVVNGATIMVTPKVPYTVGETYTLYLHSSIQSVNEQALPNTTFQFTVLSPLEIAKSVAQEAKIAAEAIKTGQPVFANPLAGTKDEITRANAFVADLEKAIATADEKVRAAKALIETAENAGATNAELAGAKANVKAAEDAIKIAKSAVLLAQEAIKTASVAAQLAVESVTVQTSSTVDVTLVSAPAYELTKADADKFRVVMDGTVLTVTDVVKSQTVNKRYTLSLLSNPLAGKQGDLTVNNTKAVIQNSEFGYDFKAPALVKVDVLDSRHLKLTFNENMEQPEITSYEIYKTTTPNTKNKVTIAVLNADKKSVTLTIDANSALEEGNYTLKTVGPVQDVAGNSVNTTVNFAVAKTQLTDTTSPSLVAAHYNVETGVLNVTFDEEVQSLKVESFSLGGVRISSESKVVPSNDKTQYQIQVANQLEINKIVTNPLKLTISSGAVEDLVGNRNVLTNFDLTVAIPPVVKEASYSEYTKLLRVIFDQVIDVKNVDPTKFTIMLNGIPYLLTGGAVQVRTNTPVVDIELTKEDSQAIEKLAGESETGRLAIASEAVTNTETPPVKNLDQEDILLTYIQNTGKPRVEKVTVTTVENRNNDTIEIQFTAPMEESTAKTLANYVFAHGNPSKVIPLTTENATAQISADRTTVTITLKGIDLQTNTDYSLQVSNIIDATGERLDPELRTGKIAGDIIAPTITTVTASASDTEDIVNVYFSEAVTKESAEKLENYTIDSPAGKPLPKPGITPTLTYLETETEFKVEIRYAKSAPTPILESGGTVEVTAENIVDLAGNPNNVGTTKNGKVSDYVAPVIISVQGRTVQSDLDEIIVTFSENVKKTMVENPANYKLEVAGVNVPLDKLKAVDDVKYDPTTFTTILYLDTSDKENGHDADDYALKNDQALTITVTNIEDDEGNAIVAPNNVVKGSVKGYVVGETTKANDEVPAKINPESIKVKNAHTIQLSWNEELDEAKLLASDFVLSKDGSSYPITPKLDATKKIVELTTTQPIAFNETNLKLTMRENPTLTDLAGNIASSFTNLAVKELGTTEMYSLKGENEKKPSSKFISIGDNQQISNLFKLTAGTTGNGEGFIIDTISFDIVTTAPVLNQLQLMWSTDNVVGNDVVVSTPIINFAGDTLTFKEINKEIASGKSGYFYIVGNISKLGTVKIDLSGTTATSAQTNFKVENSPFQKIEGEEIVIDISEPKLEFLKSDSNQRVELIVVDDSPLAYSLTKGQLKSESNYKDSFEIVDALGSKISNTVIQSARYENENNQQTITITTSTGLPTNQFIRLKAGEFTDLAGNPVASTLIAQGNGTNDVFVNPYELANSSEYEGNIVQNATVTGPITFGPSFGTKVMKGSDKTVTITGNASGPITLNNLDIKGNLTIDTPNAAVIIGNNVKVMGTVTARNISSAGITNNGEINQIKIEKSNVRFINNKITSELTLQATQLKVGGSGLIPMLKVQNPATVEIESNAKVDKLNVDSNSTIKIGVGAVVNELQVAENMTANITNSGKITKLTGSGVAFVEGTGQVSYDSPIYQKTALEALNRANNAEMIEAVLNKYFAPTALNLDLTSYNAFATNYKEEVRKAVYNFGKDYSNVSDVQSTFNNAVKNQQHQFDVDEVAGNIAKTLAVTTNGKPTFPALPSADYEISIAEPLNSSVYDQNGVGQKVGTAVVTFTVMHKTTKKTSKTGRITVTVSASQTGVEANFEVTQQGAKEQAAVAPSPVKLAGLTFTAPEGEAINGYKFVLETVDDGTTAAATVDPNTKIVTISGDFSNEDEAGEYSIASDIQTVIQNVAELSGINVTGEVVATAKGAASDPFSNGTAEQGAVKEIYTITVMAKGGVASGVGKVKFTVGGNSYEVAVTENMTVAAIANELSSLMFNVPDYIATVSANVVTLTAKKEGEMPDLIGSIVNQ